MPCKHSDAACAITLALCLLLTGCPLTSDTERLVVLSNTEAVGHVIARHDGHAVEIDYMVDNNGRGPKISERLELDANGYPLFWSISGTSLFGADVKESYVLKDGAATWSSQAEHGSASSTTPFLYVGNDTSPWSLGLYARVLLDAPGNAIDVVPAGRLELQRIHDMTVGTDETPIAIFALSGIGLTPQMIALDAANRLFAEIDGRSAVIRQGYESQAEKLQTLARRLETERIESLQKSLVHQFEQPVRINNVHVFDPSLPGRSELASVVVEDGHIAALQRPLDDASAANEVVIDGEGGTLVAGLFDMHAHNSLQTGLFYLAAGVTSTRDMGNDNALLGELKVAIDAGTLPGPRIFPAGLIEARSPYSARIGVVAESLDEALQAVRWYAEHGYIEIKTYNSMNSDWVAPIVAEARKLGLGVTGHVPAFMSPDEVIAAGYDSIAHINQLMLGWLLEPGEDTRTPLRLTGMKRAVDLDVASDPVQHTIALMREHGTALDTTAVILERLMISRAGEIQPGDMPYLAHMPIGYQRYRKRTFVPLAEPGDDEAYDAAFEQLLAVIAELHRHGVNLLIGTDDATGFTVHRELELYVKAGISPSETLAIATLGAARYLKQDARLGSIEPGKAADFFLVSGDPTRDINAIREIRLVSSRGTLYFPFDIYKAIGVTPFADKPPLRLPGGIVQ